VKFQHIVIHDERVQTNSVKAYSDFPPVYVFFVFPDLFRSPAPPAAAQGCAATAAAAESAAAESTASCAARALRFASSLILAEATQLRTCIVKHLDLQRARQAVAAAAHAPPGDSHYTQAHEYQKRGKHGN
jgi:hypothetical protein